MASKKSLDDRLKESVQPSSSNFLESPSKPEKKYEAEVLPDMREVVADARTRLSLLRYVEATAALAAEERQIKAARKPLNKQIKDLLESIGDTKFMVGGTRVCYYTVPRKSISSKLLLSAGVSPSVIAACTTTKLSPTLKITPPGVGAVDDEEED